MALPKNDINLLIEKLRSRYTEYAKKYNKTWFNITPFEERLAMAIQNRMNLEGFILAEISNFEKLKKKYEKKKNDVSFSEKVDKIINDNIARIKKYPEQKFHPYAGLEISYFYGALSHFSTYYIPILDYIIKDRDLKNRLITLEDKITFFAAPPDGKNSKRIQDHNMLLKRPGIMDIEIEKDKNNFLKEAAFLLHKIIDFCDGLIESRDESWANPLQFDQIFLEDHRKKRILKIFQGMTGYGGILAVHDYADGIIKDFRLTAFKEK